MDEITQIILVIAVIFNLALAFITVKREDRYKWHLVVAILLAMVIW